ncbi:MAG: hypothetical protein V1738_05210 [Patescibacteria group bacterium]
MNFHDVETDPQAIALTQEIMTEIGLGNEPKSYCGPDAVKTRCDAAKALAAAIQNQATKNGTEISPPNDELIRIAVVTATSFDKSSNKLLLTYEIIRLTIIGHIWLGRLAAQGAKPFNLIMAKEGIKSILLDKVGMGRNSGSGGGCSSGGDCGGCGSGGCGGCSGGCKP